MIGGGTHQHIHFLIIQNPAVVLDRLGLLAFDLGNVGNGGRIQAEDTGAGGVLSLTLPPLAGIILVPEF